MLVPVGTTVEREFPARADRLPIFDAPDTPKIIHGERVLERNRESAEPLGSLAMKPY